MIHFLIAVLAVLWNIRGLKSFRREQVERYDALCFVYQNHFNMTDRLFYRHLKEVDLTDLASHADEVRYLKRNIWEDICYETLIREYQAGIKTEPIHYNSKTLLLYYLAYKVLRAPFDHFFKYVEMRMTHQLRMFTGVDFGCIVEDIDSKQYHEVKSLSEFVRLYDELYREFVVKLANNGGVSRVYELGMDLL